ncbi:MAG: TIGR02147 family protein [Pseudobdellovibrionaceae bacterium]
MIFNYSDYRSFLREYLSQQMARNPAYSLRAFARKLELAPSSLSEILNGKKKMSHEMASRLALKLNLKARESKYFLLLADLELAASAESKNQILQQLQGLNRHRSVASLDMEMFRVISDWYHIPIIEMTRLTDFQFTPSNVAKRLGITSVEAASAIDRLVKLELIEKLKDGKFVKTKDNALFSSLGKNEALRKFYRQMLEQTSKALEAQTPQQRFSGTETFALDESYHESARQVMNDCFEKIAELAAKSKNPKNIYHLGIHFFSLTQGDHK